MKDLIDHSRQTGSGPIGAVLLTFFILFWRLNVFLFET